MCGIAGILSPQVPARSTLAAMADAVAHRGPDDGGVWSDEAAGIGFAHRRLSIVDLSPSGHQPMVSNDGRWVICYNGEIYNHLDIRGELAAEGSLSASWRGHSDTETLVEAIAVWGLEKTLHRATGMFAVALWDRHERKLHLARDRFGEKPLYYGWIGKTFAFASELKALRRVPGFSNPLSSTALRLFVSRTWIPAPWSIYEGIFKLEPGHILTVDRGVDSQREPPVTSRTGLALQSYWSYRDVVAAGLRDAISDEREALDQLELALARAISGQAVADVPVGAFLSGGIDSSTVVALYQKYSTEKVRSFSIGFAEAGFDEAQYARAVAEHLGTVHSELYVGAREAQDVIPMLPGIYDEPFADSSQIPTYLVSRFARSSVTVALSGDGGDELFAGYNRHLAVPRLWRNLNRLPGPVRRVLARPMSAVSPDVWNLVVAGRAPFFGSKVQKGWRVMAGARSLDEVYETFMDEWALETHPAASDGGPMPGLSLFPDERAPEAVRMMYADAIGYLPDDILCKVDRAAMSVSLETRVPFLDHHLAAVAARIPLSMKQRGGQGKHILRELLYRHAPRALFERPKAGFAVPIGEWLRGPLRDWAESLLTPDRLRDEGFFDPGLVSERWRRHLDGTRSSSQAIWSILMFQAWRAEWDR